MISNVMMLSMAFGNSPTLSSSNFSLRSSSSRNRIDLVVISSRSTWNTLWINLKLNVWNFGFVQLQLRFMFRD